MDTNEMAPGCGWDAFYVARALVRDHRMAPLAPGRGEGTGVRGDGQLGFRCFEPRMNTNAGVFGTTNEHEWTRMRWRLDTDEMRSMWIGL